MKLFYGAVFRGTTPLVVYSPEPGNYEKIYIDKCTKTPLPVGKSFFQIDNCLWVIHHTEQNLNILMVVQNTNDKATVEQFSDEIKNRFLRAHGSEWKTANAHELYNRFEPQFKLVKQMIESIPDDKINHEVYPPSLEEVRYAGDYGTNNYSSNLIETNEVRKPQKQTKWWKIIIAILIILVSIYFVLALSCGGLNLKPRCL